MKKVGIVVWFVTLYAVFFQLSPYIGIADEVIITMFCLAPFLVIYMVYIVLKYGKPSRYTFDEKFYDDLDYTRNGVEDAGSVS